MTGDPLHALLPYVRRYLEARHRFDEFRAHVADPLDDDTAQVLAEYEVRVTSARLSLYRQLVEHGWTPPPDAAAELAGDG